MSDDQPVVAPKRKPGPAPGGPRIGGRQKGTPNKLTGDLRAMILAALDAVGGPEYLMAQASANPSAFMTLVGKVLPTQLTGKDGGAIKTENTVTDDRKPLADFLAMPVPIIGAVQQTDANEDGTKH